MKKRLVVAGLALAPVVMCLAVLALAEPAVAAALIRYPGSIRAADDGLEFKQMGQGIITWQGVYESNVDAATVANWYADRLHVPPEDTFGPDSMGCTMMTQAELLYRVERAQVIVLCARPYGTQVVVNEKLTVWR
jgi:hypothetical protein